MPLFCILTSHDPPYTTKAITKPHTLRIDKSSPRPKIQPQTSLFQLSDSSLHLSLGRSPIREPIAKPRTKGTRRDPCHPGLSPSSEVHKLGTSQGDVLQCRLHPCALPQRQGTATGSGPSNDAGFRGSCHKRDRWFRGRTARTRGTVLKEAVRRGMPRHGVVVVPLRP